MKKILSKLLIFILVFSMLLSSSLNLSYAMNNQQVSTNNDNLKVKSTNSFGKLLESEINNKTNEKQENNGCNIFSIEVENNIANVEFETTKDATLVVGIYDELGEKLVISGNLDVKTGDTNVQVNIDGSIPEYFFIKGYLVEKDTYKPYCLEYTSPNYTKEMQNFLSKSTDDFDKDKVLNLDEDKENNFAVYNENTKVIKENNNINKILEKDDINQKYVIENIDSSVTSLKAGDTFSYEYNNGEVLIVKIGSLSISGTTATITGIDAEAEEVFDYVKIDETASLDDATVDDSTCDEGVIYEGLSSDNSKAKSRAKIGASGSNTTSLSYKLESEQFPISGSVNLKVKTSFKVYITKTIKYIELKNTDSLSLNLEIEAKLAEKKFKLARLGFIISPGLIVEFTPSFIIEASAKIEVNGTVTLTLGVACDGKGIKNLSSSPKFDSEIKGDITVFLGLSLEPKIKVFSDVLAEVKADFTGGVEIKGQQVIKDSDPSIYHECMECLDGDLTLKATIKADISFLKMKNLTFTRKFNTEYKFGDFYYSFDRNVFGFGECPYLKYKILVTVKDDIGNPLSDAKVNTLTTDNKGKVETYLQGGKQKIKISKSGYVTKNKEVSVSKGKNVVVKLKKEDDKNQNNDNDKREGEKYFIPEIGKSYKIESIINNDIHAYVWMVPSQDCWIERFDSDSYGFYGSRYIGHYTEQDLNSCFYSFVPGNSNDFDEFKLLSGNVKFYVFAEGEEKEDFYSYFKVTPINHDPLIKIELKIGEKITLDYQNLNGSRLDYSIFGNNLEWNLTITDYSKKLLYGGDIEEVKYTQSSSFTHLGDITGGCMHTIELTQGSALLLLKYDDFKKIKFTPKVDNCTDVLGFLKKSSLTNNKSASSKIINKGLNETKTVYADKLNTHTFTNLKPFETYNYYVMKNKDTSNDYSEDNLLHIGQGIADKDGTLNINFKTKESYDQAKIFVSGINNIDISEADINIKNLTYNGNNQSIHPIIKYKNKTLVEGEDYEVIGDFSAINVGSYNAKIVGEGIFGGSKTISYTIEKGKQNSLSFPQYNMYYTNDVKYFSMKVLGGSGSGSISYQSSNPSIASIDKNGNVTPLKEGMFYITVTKNGDSNYNEQTIKSNIITITKSNGLSVKGYSGIYDGKSHTIAITNVKPNSTIEYRTNQTGKWSTKKPTRTNVGTTIVYYQITNPNYKTIIGSSKIVINKRNISGLSYSKVANKTYTGKQVKPNITIKNGKKTLKKGTDYTVSYGKNKNTGKASITIKGKGNYIGSRTISFYIVPKKVTISSVKPGKKQLTVKYKKVTGVSGYQIAYSTSKTKGFKYITVNAKTASKVIKKLKSKKSYFIKVRAYKSVGKKKYYGSYSSIKTVKVK